MNSQPGIIRFWSASVGSEGASARRRDGRQHRLLAIVDWDKRVEELWARGIQAIQGNVAVAPEVIEAANPAEAS